MTAESKEVQIIHLKDIQPAEFGIDGEKATQITKAFLIKEGERDGYHQIYLQIIGKEISPEVIEEARRLRLDLVKVRTGVAKVHTAEKAYFLAAGKLCDALKNKLTLSCEQMEENLHSIETHFLRLEEEKKKKIKAARTELLAEFPDCDPNNYKLEEMSAEDFKKLLSDQADLAKIKAERLEREAAEAEAKQKAEQVLQARKNEIAPFTEFLRPGSTIDLGEMSCEDYAQLIDSLKAAKKEQDEEQAKTKAENDRLKSEAEAKEKEAAAKLKAEQDKAAKEKAEAEAREKELNEKLAKEKADREKLEKEKAEKEKAEKEAKEKAEAEKKASEEAAKKAPDKQKIKAAVDTLKMDIPEMNSNEGAQLLEVILEKFAAFKGWANTKIDKA